MLNIGMKGEGFLYKYKYVRAKVGGFFSESNYREIIDQHAKEGWRLVQVLPIDYNGHGRPEAFDVIFESKVQD